MIAGIAQSFLAGIVVGAAYFLGLWLTVRRFGGWDNPSPWLLASAAARLVLLAAVLVWLVDGEVSRAFAALAGLLAARTLALRIVRIGGANADHAR